jgi:glutathione S-transferase
MVKLYYTSTSCGAASFTAAFAAGVKLEAETVDLASHKTASGADFYAINPKGNVPALILDDGTVLNEGAAVLQWIADQRPGTIAPVNGTTARYQVIQQLNYIASEVHPSIGGLFYASAHDEVKNSLRAKAALKLAYLEKNLVTGGKYLVGDSLTIADLYLWIVLSWTGYLNVDITPYPSVVAFFKKVSESDVVKGAAALIATKPAYTTA